MVSMQDKQIVEGETNQFRFERFSIKVPIFLYFMEKNLSKIPWAVF